ncbi:MAG: HlyD family efflux transporter periplasmic adaptor subunit [Bacteroidales bacterium]|nr:HlyD family efflux transporter periplasmic adaptor subunit [Bacteroidales bacterium]
MDRIIEKRKWTVKKVGYLAVGVLFLAFITYLLFFRDNASKLYVDIHDVTITTVLQDKFQEFIPIDGVVYPKETYFIDAIQGGSVEAIFATDGDMVKKGDTLLKLLNTSMELSYMEQETRMLAEINNLQNTALSLEQNKYIRQKEIVTLEYEIDKAKREFARKVQLYNQGVISEKEFEDAERDNEFTTRQLNISLKLQRLDSLSRESQRADIELSLDRMHDNIRLLRKNMENAYVKAPADGKLSSFNLKIGETKSVGVHLGQIDVPNDFRLEAQVDERYISRVFIGQEAAFDYGGQTYDLYVDKIYTDVTNGSFRVDLFFTDDKAPKAIKRGQTIQVKLKFSSETEAVVIKRGGFFQETGGNWIFVVDPSGDFAVRRNIKINRQNTRFYEVLEGIEPGEQVVISRYDSFRDKEKLIFK